MNKFFKSLSYILFIGILLVSGGCSEKSNKSNETISGKPKYVFLFIGDGMGSTHVALSEAYFANTTGNIGFENLTMTSFPVFGQCETQCKNRQITDSGAAGSAIACGEKANVDAISYFENPINNNTESIAKIAHKNGLKTGIISTVSIDHATPAAFYAINENRKNYYEIALDLLKSNFEFFGGGGFYYPDGKNKDRENLSSVVQNNGYKLYNSYESLKNISKEDNKVIFINPITLNEGEMPYTIDRKNYKGANLNEIVETGINFLNNENGFFMMVEGGKIDWCSHSNDAATLIHEVKDFDDAIKTAYDFYLKNPDETLIIVTADHETGGLSMGIAINDYESNFSILKNQKCSQQYFVEKIEEYKNSMSSYNLNEIIELAFSEFYEERFELSQEEISNLTMAFDYYFYNKTNKSTKEIYKLYGGYNPVAVTFSQINNNRASVGFSSWSHTGTKVPVYSIGNGSEKFKGNMDNTEFKYKIMKIMNW